MKHLINLLLLKKMNTKKLTETCFTSIRVLLLFSFAFMFSANVFAQRTRYHFEHLSSKDGLVAGVHSIVRDSEGFIWFATMSGLYRYDGINFKIFYYDPADSTTISGTFLESSLFEDSEGTLWVGTAADGLNRYNKFTESFERFKHDPKNSKSLVSNNVTCIYEDRNHVLWIGSNHGFCEYHPETKTFTSYLQYPDTTSHLNDEIETLFEDNKGNFYVGTTNGLFLFDRQTRYFSLMSEVSEVYEPFKNIAFRDIIESKNGIFWFATNAGLIKYNSIAKTFKRFQTEPGNPKSLHDNDILKMVVNPVDNGKSIWISTSGGLSRFNIEDETFLGFVHDPSNPTSLSGNIITSIYIDKEGILWIGNESFGVDMLNLNKRSFTYYDLIPPKPEKEYTTAVSFFYTDEDELWVGSHTDGLFRFDKNMKLIKWYNFDPDEQTAYTINFIRFVLKDSKGNVWAGTSGDGIYVLKPGSSKFTKVPILDEADDQLVWIYRIFEDSRKTVWFLLNTGIYYLDSDSKSLIALSDVTNDPIVDTRPFTIEEDKNGNIWISSRRNGLYQLTPENRKTLRFNNFTHNPSDAGSLSANVVRAIYCDEEGNVWIGTDQGLNLYDEKSNSFIKFGEKDGLIARLIYHITSDHQGRLWMTTEKGFISYNRMAPIESRSKIYELRDNLPFSDVFTQYFYKNKYGKIFVGGRKSSQDGFFCFYPDSLVSNTHIPPIVITDFKIKNEPVTIDSSITQIRKLHLTYDENFISFQFAALDFVNPDRNEYAYKLEGLEDKWNFSGNRAFANYTGVPPGNYTFRVKGSNNDGVWNEEGTRVAITISPPFYRTGVAYVFYVLLVIGIFYGWHRYDLKRQQLGKDLELEHLQTEKLAELDRMKSQFFANISHEFRTPLTLILGPLEKVVSRIKDKELVQDLDIMGRNAKRLQHLINQLLSLSKLESGKMNLEARPENIVQLVKVYAQSFVAIAQSKHIDYRFNCEDEEFILYVDRDKIEKIITNLLSNAFKFTADGGTIILSISPFSTQKQGHSSGKTKTPAIPPEAKVLSDGIMISVEDTGRGIAPEKLKNIFNRFYQAHESTNGDYEGTGIGLALAKELVELHKGIITVSSKPGTGTTFTVYFQSGKEHLTPEQIVSQSETDKTNFIFPGKFSTEVPFSDREISEEEIDDSAPIVLVVEDNTDMRLFIKGYLEKSYTVIEAENGEDGLQKAIDYIPDLIISDVMMPVMNGIEMCKKLKLDEKTSHIPVIILTAKATTESKIEGLETGADAFLTKPFDAKELQIRIKNLIEQRNKLRDKFIKKLDTGVPIRDTGIAPMDQAFIVKAKEVVEKYMSDSDFSVQTFCREMAMSRVQLHRKLTALTNQSTSRFIRSLRLKRAAELLLERTANVSEVAFDVGFSNLSWFAKCFHEQYGVPPSDYYSTK